MSWRSQGAVEFIDRYSEILEIIGAGYSREGKHYLTLAIGCTGGKHRSVVIGGQFADRLSGHGGAGHGRQPGSRS